MASMSRKHYREAAEMIADCLKNTATYSEEAAVARVAQGLADMYKRDNSAFRYDRFFEACGLDSFGQVES